MILSLLKEHFNKNARPPLKHSNLYPTQSSAFIEHPKYKKLEGKCMRAVYYNCLGVPEQEELTVEKNLIFRIGDYTEKMILDILEKDGKLIDKGVKFTIDKYNISGKLDAIFDYNGRKVGLEIKSIGSNKYSIASIFGNQWNDPFPKWQNLFQTLVYCYAFKDEIDEFILLYIRRDTCEIKEFVISVQPKDGKLYGCIDGKIDYRFCINDILERYKTISGYVENKKLPPREYMKVYPREHIKDYVRLGVISKFMGDKYKEEPFGDFECRYCGYSKRCDQNDQCLEFLNDTHSS